MTCCSSACPSLMISRMRECCDGIPGEITFEAGRGLPPPSTGRGALPVGSERPKHAPAGSINRRVHLGRGIRTVTTVSGAPTKPEGPKSQSRVPVAEPRPTAGAYGVEQQLTRDPISRPRHPAHPAVGSSCPQFLQRLVDLFVHKHEPPIVDFLTLLLCQLPLPRKAPHVGMLDAPESPVVSPMMNSAHRQPAKPPVEVHDGVSRQEGRSRSEHIF
jgi:hypothetical protein